jgi:uncharacterized protein YndB with AHSA1/START domain
MARFDRIIFIEAPPERVWAQLTDFEATADWWVNIAWSRQVETGPVKVGTTTESIVQGFGLREHTRGRIVVCEPPRRLELESHGERGTRSWLECELEPNGNGTRLMVSIEFRLPGGKLGNLIGKVGEGQLRRDFDHSLKNLQELIIV